MHATQCLFSTHGIAHHCLHKAMQHGYQVGHPLPLRSSLTMKCRSKNEIKAYKLLDEHAGSAVRCTLANFISQTLSSVYCIGSHWATTSGKHSYKLC